ncbi:FxSxx-COOH system tetratricopeptide repeat protein [[Actinomadura] parvosata]|uniref:FxSxx-COOH system tetratricopeptide repeat protein n=1 Tax=[Actinomadura] parvosata TaxID=1955412 RepID=UPI00406D410D
MGPDDNKDSLGGAPEVWGRVPARNRIFTGREALLQQIQRSVRDVAAVVPLPQALHGLGGVGKTQLATEYAWRHRMDYDLVWWITADQPVLVPAALAALAPRLGVPQAETVGIEESAEAVREALQRGEPYSRWLLVFDNADQPESIRDYIPANGHVLITSRNTRWETAAVPITVDTFERAESVEYLMKRLRGIGREEADQIAEALGDLPLALEQAGALLALTAMSIPEYLQQLEQNTRELLASSKSTDYPLSMTAAWRLSVGQLQARCPEAIDILRCCAFFGPEPIPRDLFRKGRGVAPDKLSEVLTRPIVVTKAIGELNRFALAKVDSENRTIQVHRLIQALLRDDLTDDEQAAVRHDVHLLLANGAPTDPEKSETWRHWGDLVAHLRPSQVAECQDSKVRNFAINIVRFLYRRGHYQTAREVAEELLRTWTETSGPTHIDVLQMRRHLGNVLWQVGEFEKSYELNHDTLTMAQETLGPEAEETLLVINNYGANLRARGEFAEAKKLDTTSRELHEKVFGPTSAVTLRAINNLALDHALVSDYEGARALHEEAYIEYGSGAGEATVWGELNTRIGLSRVVRLCGDFSDAYDAGVEAYDYGRSELGAQHPLTLKAAKDLSIAMRLMGDVEEALKLAESTHTILKSLFGVRHPDTMAAAVNLANAFRQAGELSRAFALTTKTVPRYTEVYGREHPYTLGCRGNLALLYRLLGRPDEARATNEEVREALAGRLGADHDYALSCSFNLAGDLAALDEPEAARDLDRATLDAARHRFRSEHFMIFAGNLNLTLDLRAAGEIDEADRLLAQLREVLEENPSGNDHRVALLNSGRVDLDFDPPPL